MSSTLTITKDAFRQELQARIAEGQAILKQYSPVAGEEESRKLHRAFERWNKNNHAWLGHVFSEERNSYQRDYENAGAWNTEKVLAAQNMSPDSLRYKLKFFQQSITPKIEYLEDLLDSTPYIPVLLKLPEPQSMAKQINSEEIIKKQAGDAVTTAERYGIHNHQGKYVEVLREQSLKLYQPAAKATYFQEAIRLVEEKIAAHRSVCKEGSGCPKDRKYEEAIFFLQQELDILPKPVINPVPSHQFASLSHPQSPALMNKRYQIFISSTFADLQSERLKVQQAVMELDCIPAGMEAFPAIDEEQFEFIKRVIDNCDYYLLIIGGRYGSMSKTGVSYTEMEYDYAVSKGIKAIVLLHKEPGLLPLNKSEQTQEARKKLDTFRAKVSKGRLVKFWNNADELPGLVASSLSITIKNYPAVGWVRASSIPNALIPEENKITPTALDTVPSITIAALHPTIQSVAGKLFADAHYPQAIHAACTALEKAIQVKSGQSASVTGTTLLGKAFPKDNPLIMLSADQGEREGYGFLYRGLLQAIRNHYAHNLTGIDPNRALEWLGFISALFYKLEDAVPESSPPTP
jgi:uncharacterized protein (TIGR02391 family)